MIRTVSLLAIPRFGLPDAPNASSAVVVTATVTDGAAVGRGGVRGVALDRETV